MRIKDLKVGLKVWYGNDRMLRGGEGNEATVHRIGQFTTVREPCGLVIVESPTGDAKYVLKLKETGKRILVSQGGYRRNRYTDSYYRDVAYLNTSRSRQQYILVADGRMLMPDEEHAIMRRARDDRQLEIDAHNARGEALVEKAQKLVSKTLAEHGVPEELVDVAVRSRYVGEKYRVGVIVNLDDDKVQRLVKSRELERVLKEYDDFRKLPVPGKDCAV